MTLKSYHTLDVQGKRVLIRVDFNVPVKSGKILDDTRLRAALPTVKDVQARGGKVILLTHFGRPKGRDPLLSTAFLQPTLEEIFEGPVLFAPDGVAPSSVATTQHLQDGEILLVENLRFHAGEEKNDPTFAKELALLGDVYINDSFSISHRAHASVEGITKHLPSAAGACLLQEVEAVARALTHPKLPVAALVAGSKISTKLALLENLLPKVDFLILGGGIANTFLRAQGYPIGSSLVEEDMIHTAQQILEKAPLQDCRIVLPRDAVVAETLEGGNPHTTTLDPIKPTEKIFDIGPQTVTLIQEILDTCQTIVWNGPMGVFEVAPFHEGTAKLAQHVGSLTQKGQVFSIAGGGETVAAITSAGAAPLFSYLSLAGGAFLEYLEGKTLPGVSALKA